MSQQDGEVRRYAERDAFALDKAGDYYSRHTDAMTREGLHAKSDIAAELAHRDQQIDALAARLAEAESLLRRHGKHDDDCTWRIPFQPPRGFSRRPCSCGLDAALARQGGG